MPFSQSFFAYKYFSWVWISPPSLVLFSQLLLSCYLPYICRHMLVLVVLVALVSVAAAAAAAVLVVVMPYPWTFWFLVVATMLMVEE